MNVLTINEHIMNIFSSNNEEKIQNSLDFLNNINEFSRKMHDNNSYLINLYDKYI